MTARFRGRPDGNVKRYSWFSIGGLSVAKKEVNGSSCGSRIGLSLHVPIVYLGRGSWSSKWKNTVENGVWSFSRDGQNDLRHLLYVSRRPNGDMVGANKAKGARRRNSKRGHVRVCMSSSCRECKAFSVCLAARERSCARRVWRHNCYYCSFGLDFVFNDNILLIAVPDDIPCLL